MAPYANRLFTTAAAVFNKLKMNSPDLPDIFLPPINRSMRTLDRSFFKKTIPLSAATVSDTKKISDVRSELQKSGDLLRLGLVKGLRDDETAPGAKCFLLQPGVDAAVPSTWSPTLTKLAEERLVRVRPYDLTLTYDDWTMHNILEATLPELPEEEKETPAGFAKAGHLAHVNLRDIYLPYKHLIGQVLLDKNPAIRTVINKTFDVGSESVFRTFPYEVLAGADDLDVIVHESGCEFRFNFGKVYWNSRLHTEHARIFEKFHPGDAVCDIMAGVGPFAVPAGKRGIFVRANDLNPDCYEALKDAISRNKVTAFVTASCEDGRSFIRRATTELAINRRIVELQPKLMVPRHATKAEKEALMKQTQKETHALVEPAAFNHYVMNLPATAIEFLDAFKGIYHGREAEFIPNTACKLPMIHVYLFQSKLDSEEAECEEICARISQHIGTDVELDDEQAEMELHYVRLVSPKKKMYCASFRLPPTIAFAQPERGFVDLSKGFELQTKPAEDL